jgi:iron complex transport system substrate-binding protein
VRPVNIALAGVLAGVLGLAGCSQPDGTAAAPSAQPSKPAATGGGFPVTVQAGNGPVILQKRPERIVSLSATATEMLFAMGAGRQVIAVDDQSDYPPDAPKTSLSGYKPNVEAIVATKPDLVVLSDDLEGVIAGLGKIGVPVIHEPAATTIDEAYDQMADLGTATGHGPEATALVAGIKEQFDITLAATPKAKGLTYYHELDNTPYAATSKTFIGQIYNLFGLVNIADEAPDAAGGYPKLSAEFIAEADPDLIFLADTKCCGQNAKTLAERPGWAGLRAIKSGDVVELDDDIASRWGPRMADMVKAVGQAVRKAAR